MKKIFISWSGENSKKIASELKNILENCIFKNSEFKCFFSDEDIDSGSDWWSRIKKELDNSSLGIVCFTKENISAPWIYFESGAIITKKIDVIPLLINCSNDSLKNTPLKNFQAVNFYEERKFFDMIRKINTKLNLNVDEVTLNQRIINGYNLLKNNLNDVLKELRDTRIFNLKYVYPEKITTIQKNTLYISVPMSTMNRYEYNKLRKFILELIPFLKEIGFTEIYGSILNEQWNPSFCGEVKALTNNLEIIKQCECMLVIHPKNIPTSVLVEIGYGIALCKKIIVFNKENLPYMLANAMNVIPHYKSYSYNNYEEIIDKIKQNGACLFSTINNID